MSEPDTTPDQRRTIPLRYMLRRVRGTRTLLDGADITDSLFKQPRLHCDGLANAPPPGFLNRRRDRLQSCLPPAPQRKPRARGTPGVPMDPRASTPRDIEACRSPLSAASPPNPKASRARCFLGLLRADPGGQTIFTHRCGPWALLRHLYPVTACRAAGPARLGPPGLATASPIAKEFPGHRSPPRVWRR